MKYNNEQFLQHYQSSNVSNSFLEVCSPLLDLGFKEVSYIRVYSDNSIYVLTTANLWLNNFLSIFCDYDLTLFREKIANAVTSISDVYCAWNYNKQDSLLEFNHHYQMDQGFDIYKRKKDYVELWSFIAKTEMPMFHDFCISNLAKINNTINTCQTSFINQEGLFFAKKALIPLDITRHFHNKFLTYREIECTRLIIAGNTTKEIARNLDIAPKTVEVHIKNIKQKTGYHNRHDLIQIYRNHLQ